MFPYYTYYAYERFIMLLFRPYELFVTRRVIWWWGYKSDEEQKEKKSVWVAFSFGGVGKIRKRPRERRRLGLIGNKEDTLALSPQTPVRMNWWFILLSPSEGNYYIDINHRRRAWEGMDLQLGVTGIQRKPIRANLLRRLSIFKRGLVRGFETIIVKQFIHISDVYL